jgi:hypothetical protein
LATLRNNGLLAGILCLIPALNVMAEQKSVQQSINYVLSLDGACIYEHGYVCAQNNEASLPEQVRNAIPAVYLEAWAIALQDFKQIDDLTEGQKQMKHYNISFAEDKDTYIVSFDALLLPHIDANNQPYGVMHATYGRSTKYWMNKDNLNIQKRLFMK